MTSGRARLFVAACLLGGIGGLVGSIVGSAAGRTGLFAGGLVGGAIAAPISARLACWRGWVSRRRFWPTTAGAAVGFLATAAVAVTTLSSPVGPVLATSLTGIGAVVGSVVRRRQSVH